MTETEGSLAKRIYVKIQNLYLDKILLHLIILTVLYFVLYHVGIIKVIPSNQSLMQWDAWWYKSVMTDGYSFTPDKQSNLAFFPLFPYIWKIFNCSSLIISILNLFLFLLSFILLGKTLKLTTGEFLLFLSTPSLFFCYVPYSEAIFFLSTTIFITGLVRNKLWIALIGMFLACFSRSSSMMFIPAMIFAGFMYFDKNIQTYRKQIIFISLIILSSLLATFLVNLIQYIQTDEVFAIFKALSNWNRKMQFPKLPFTTWNYTANIKYDGSAFFVCLLALLSACNLLFKKLKNFNFKINHSYGFSIGYLILILIFLLVFPYITKFNRTSFLSINRYIFATPFFIVFLKYLMKYYQIDKFSIAVFLITIVITLFLFDVFSFIKISKIILLLIYWSFYFLLLNNSLRKYVWIILYAINIYLQLFLFSSFIRGAWIG